MSNLPGSNPPPVVPNQPQLLGQPPLGAPSFTVPYNQFTTFPQPFVQPVVAQSLLQQPLTVSPVITPPVVTQPVVTQSVVQQPVQQLAPIAGQSRIEYIPYERSVLEYEEVRQRVQIPRERYITDYYQIEYQTEYIPQVTYDKFTEYVPVERYQERVEYYPVERQVGVSQVVTQPIVTPAPVVTQTVPVATQPVAIQQPLVASTVVPQYQPTFVAPVPITPVAPVQTFVPTTVTQPGYVQPVQPLVATTVPPQQQQASQVKPGSLPQNKNDPKKPPQQQKSFLDRLFE